ncbi:hypothetical protein EVAR_8319_1 [Eumeta japonica]|uniref:Uncharacterized protein n=1 Tax=Eumeta variegata TaxID=151549 RepID=A0A4C1VCI0_EUMVA|nr:hypothetical protein EVAR_8319_1 [Eumeta japonica]
MTKPAGALPAGAGGYGGRRAAAVAGAQPPDPDAPAHHVRTVGGVATRGGAARRGRGDDERAANGAPVRGRRCSERSSLRAPAPRPAAAPHSHAATAAAAAPKR